MNSTRTIRNRIAGAAVAVGVLTGAMSLGLTTAAQAETPPGSEPGQVVIDWDPAAGGLWGTSGTGNGGGTGIDWVASTFTYTGTDVLGNDSYVKTNGTTASSAEQSQLAAAMNYGGGCSSTYNSTEVVCSN